MTSALIRRPSLDAGEGVFVPGPGGSQPPAAPRGIRGAGSACLR
jgi:hypothetical protein